jgi:hypothetical protein
MIRSLSVCFNNEGERERERERQRKAELVLDKRKMMKTKELME